jgi:hypothetical protein
VGFVFTQSECDGIIYKSLQSILLSRRFNLKMKKPRI